MDIGDRVKKRLGTIMKKFHVEEFETEIMPHFPELSWISVRKKLIKNHLLLTTKNAVELIQNDIEELNISLKILLKRLSILELLEISRHSSLKTWFAYKMTSPLEERIFEYEEKEIEDRILRLFENGNIDVHVQMMNYNCWTFLSLTMKEQKAKRLIPATFFVLFTGRDHFFCSKKNANELFLTTVTQALNYAKRKKLFLQGKDLKSLLTMLNCRETQTIPGDAAPEQFETEPVENEQGIDATEHRQRKKFLEGRFGTEPIKIESLSVEVKDFSVQSSVLNLQRCKLPTEWVFKSSNVIVMLPKLAERNILRIPLPSYLHNLMLRGKTQMLLKDVQIA